MTPDEASRTPPEPEKSFQELRDSGVEHLASWIREQLLGRGEGPHSIDPRGPDADVTDGIISILEPGFDENQRKRLSEAVAVLISDWKESTDPRLEFLGGLLVLIGGLELSAPKALLQHLDGSLKGRSCRFGDVHGLALGALSGSMREEGHVIYILRRDIRDPRYAGSCANMLLERAPERAEQYLPDLINVGTRHREQVGLELLLRTALETLTVGTFLDSLREGMGMLVPATPSGTALVNPEGCVELVRICRRFPELYLCRNYAFDTPIVMILSRDGGLYRDPLLVPLSDSKELREVESESGDLDPDALTFYIDWTLERFAWAKDRINAGLNRLHTRLTPGRLAPAALYQPP